MRKISLAVLAGVLLACVPAFAGNEISLGPSTGSPIKFTGTGGADGHSFSINFNITNLDASGFGTLLSTGTYSITNAGATVFSNGNCGMGCFMLGQTGPLAFKYNQGADILLTGNLFFTDISQSAIGGGIFNDSLMINFVVTGGDLAGAFASSNGIITLQIKFTTNQDLASIMMNQNLMAKVVSGSVFPVPEPASLALMSAGLLGLAGLCKKKLGIGKEPSMERQDA